MRSEKPVPGNVSLIASVKTHPAGRVGSATHHSHDRTHVAVLAPRDGGLSTRLGSLFGGVHPVLVFLFVMICGLALIGAVSIGLGFLVIHVLERGSLGAADERVNVWLAAHRSPGRTDASLIGSIMAGGVVLPIVAGVLALGAAVLRKWRLVGFFLFVLAVESAAYRITTLAIHSHRPRVPRLESLPVNASYPSGHTAAALAVYGGLALVLTSELKNKVVGVIAWLLVVAIVVFVATSRMYRGMHHPFDVAGGIVVGIGALCVLVVACRAAGAAEK
jgi:undecaprenyl-diphosphatase